MKKEVQTFTYQFKVKHRPYLSESLGDTNKWSADSLVSAKIKYMFLDLYTYYTIQITDRLNENKPDRKDWTDKQESTMDYLESKRDFVESVRNTIRLVDNK